MSRARRRSTEQHVPKEAQTNYKKCGSRYRQKQNFVPLCCFGRLHTAAHTENPVRDSLYLHWGLHNCSHASQAGLAHFFAFCQSFSSSKRTDPSSVTSLYRTSDGFITSREKVHETPDKRKC